MSAPELVDRVDLEVVFVRRPDGLAGIREAWQELERVVPLRGHHFYGTFAGEEYRACAQLREGEDYPLERGTIPGGRYARVRLHGEPPALYERIGPEIESLAAIVAVDSTRPFLEHYRRHDVIDLLVPVA